MVALVVLKQTPVEGSNDHRLRDQGYTQLARKTTALGDVYTRLRHRLALSGPEIRPHFLSFWTIYSADKI